MGKNAVIKSLAKCIGNVALHKVVLKHSSMPESAKHIKDEIRDYSSDAFEKAQLYKWTNKEKEEIETRSKIRVKNILKRYSDIVCGENEIEHFVNETLKEMLI